ncbi:DUF11 domain-containing protein [Kitasatospora sp. NPDC002227]|uniref:DUF11 domain-containing protein n=1 Tax=Kitasatospora sp. NPDC002227 TaxID=3154773 RepID=UPI0033233D1F
MAGTGAGTPPKHPSASRLRRTAQVLVLVVLASAGSCWTSAGSAVPAAARSQLQAVGRISGGRIAPGETFKYTITVVNHGPSAARDVVVTDRLPGALSYVSTRENCTAHGQKVTCGPLPLLAPGATASWVILVRLDPAYTGDGSDIANQGTVVSATTDPVPANNTGPTPGAGLPSGAVTGPTADLSVAKKPSGTAPVAPGETFEYVITVVNHGPSDAKAVTVTDQLPPMLAFVSSSAGCSGPADGYGAKVTCSGPAGLAATGSQAFPLRVRLDPAYRGDGADVVNRATVGSTTLDPAQGNNTAVATGLPNPDTTIGPAAPNADHTVTVSSAAAVHPGGRSTARLTVTNLGPSTRRKPASVTVTMPEHTTVPSSGLPPECTAENGGRQLSCTVAPGRRALEGPYAVDFPVALVPSAPPGATLTGGRAVVRSPEDRNPGNDSADWTAAALDGSADLETAKRAVLPAGKTAVVPGDVFGYRVSIVNHGPSDARAVTVTDPLPAPLTFVSSPDGCSATGRTVTCRTVGDLPAGETADFTFAVRLAAQFRGGSAEVDNIATASSATSDPVPANNANPPGTTGPDGGPLPLGIPREPVPPGPRPDRWRLPETGSRLPAQLPVTAGVALLAGAGCLLAARRLRRPGRRRAGR